MREEQRAVELHQIALYWRDAHCVTCRRDLKLGTTDRSEPDGQIIELCVFCQEELEEC